MIKNRKQIFITEVLKSSFWILLYSGCGIVIMLSMRRVKCTTGELQCCWIFFSSSPTLGAKMLLVVLLFLLFWLFCGACYSVLNYTWSLIFSYKCLALAWLFLASFQLFLTKIFLSICCLWAFAFLCFCVLSLLLSPLLVV